jgi:hypothetical protein
VRGRKKEEDPKKRRATTSWILDLGAFTFGGPAGNTPKKSFRSVPKNSKLKLELAATSKSKICPQDVISS